MTTKRRKFISYPRKSKKAKSSVPINKTWNNEAPDTINETKGSINRISKKGYGIAFGYIGTGYHGMQKQLDSEKNEIVKTIEGELERALYKVGGISSENFGQLQKIHWSRVARTDKGVHAAGQFVALKLILDTVNSNETSVPNTVIPDIETADTLSSDTQTKKDTLSNDDIPLPQMQTDDNNINNSIEDSDGADSISTMKIKLTLEEQQEKEFNFIQLLQQELNTMCSTIKIFNIYRVTKSFDARRLCEKRAYRYLLPIKYLTSCILSNEATSHPGYEFFFKLDSSNNKITELNNQNDNVKIIEIDETFIQNSQPQQFKEKTDKPLLYTDMTRSMTDKEMDALVEQVQLLMMQYRGNHSFHNFTSRLSASDPSSWRIMEDFQVERESIHGIEMLVISLVGQSFLLNQIRKMLGLIVEIIRGSAPLNSISECLQKHQKRQIHMVPAAGLFLDKVFYDSYNTRRANPPTTPYLDFNDITLKMKEFRETVIYPTIIEEFQNENELMWKQWIENINKYPFFVTNYPPQTNQPQVKKQCHGSTKDIQIIEETVLPDVTKKNLLL